MEIILGVVMFTLIVLVLSGLIRQRSKLVNAGDVVIEINNEADKQIRTPAGDKLLNTLSSNGSLSPPPAAAAAPAASVG
jgi:Na+-transporting NADH:ubiquinone oxidoreductase subunit F